MKLSISLFIYGNTNLGFRNVKSRIVNFYLTFVHTSINFQPIFFKLEILRH